MSLAFDLRLGTCQSHSQLTLKQTRLSSELQQIRPKRDESSRISFMSNNSNPYAMFLQRMRSFECDNEPKPVSSLRLPSSFESTKSELYNTKRTSEQSDLGVHDTLLLDLVRLKSCDIRESQDKTLELPKDHDNEIEELDALYLLDYNVFYNNYLYIP
ncbi:unnamed protein product [Parnassius apollo]|uniref:(apollo) hypothetical protein n=1 Tax=Parnassius apollo TaxID=110799 RepID=A0A8S3WED4_PARAO|nr:unnamed protein product [Parnassius apollo]